MRCILSSGPLKWIVYGFAVLGVAGVAVSQVPDPSTADFVNNNKSASFSWNSAAQWTPTGVPNAPGVFVHVEKTSGGDRNVELGGQAITLGTILENNYGTSTGRNRVRSGRVIFDSGNPNEPARIYKIGESAAWPGWPMGNPPLDYGTDDARLEFRMDGGNEFVRMESDLVIHVDAPNVDQGGQVRFRGSLEGPGNLILDGRGEVRFRGDGEGVFNPITQKFSGQHDYTYTGETIIQDGLLRLRMGDLVNTSAIRVEDGGQLRLDARGNVSNALADWMAVNYPPWASINAAGGAGRPVEFFYELGGPNTVITLNGHGRDFQDELLGGPHGALRMHGQGTQHDIGWVANNIVIDDFAAIMTDRANADPTDLTTYPEITQRGSILHLTGNISGGDMIKRGGGFLHLHGSNHSYGDTIVHNGELIVQPGSSLGVGALEFTYFHPLDPGDISTANARLIRLNNTAQSVSRLSGIVTGGGEIQVVLGSNHTLTVNQNVDSEFQGAISGASGTFIKSGTGRLIVTGTSTYGGGTTVSDGTLLVRGQLNPSSFVNVASNGVLAGSGRVGALSGAGTIRPEYGEADIATRLIASSLNGSAAMDFQFLVNGLNANTTAFNAVNSVLELEQGFAAPLAVGSTVDLLFNSSQSISDGMSFTAGFLTSQDHLASITNAVVRGYQNGQLLNWSFGVDTTQIGGKFLTRFTAQLTSLPGDFNNDGFFNCADVDALVAEIASSGGTLLYDLTGDGLVTSADLDQWLAIAGATNLPSGNPYLRGDANLDGTVDGQDFIVWNGNKFSNTPAWCSADFNADGVIDGQDFIAWNNNKFTSSDAVTAAPEPAGVSSLLALMLLLGAARSRRGLENQQSTN